MPFVEDFVLTEAILAFIDRSHVGIRGQMGHFGM